MSRELFVLLFACFALGVSICSLIYTVRSFHRTTGKWFPWQVKH